MVLENHISENVKENAIQSYNQGVDESQQGHYESAIDAYQKAIQLNPEYANAYSRQDKDEGDDAAQGKLQAFDLLFLADYLRLVLGQFGFDRLYRIAHFLLFFVHMVIFIGRKRLQARLAVFRP